jgi:hypothetical protein
MDSECILFFLHSAFQQDTWHGLKKVENHKIEAKMYMKEEDKKGKNKLRREEKCSVSPYYNWEYKETCRTTCIHLFLLVLLYLGIITSLYKFWVSGMHCVP